MYDFLYKHFYHLFLKRDKYFYIHVNIDGRNVYIEFTLDLEIVYFKISEFDPNCYNYYKIPNGCRFSNQ